jgi:hypothetical protein
MASEIEPSNDEAPPASTTGDGIFLSLSIVLAGILAGLAASVILFLGEDIVSFTIALQQNRTEITDEGFASEYESSVSAFTVFWPFVSLLTFIAGRAFLEINRQSSLLKYVSGATTGALCMGLPAILLVLGKSALMALPFAIAALLAGAIGAVIFLGIVHLFDYDSKFFKSQDNELSITTNPNDAGPKL